jgi:hypothetical protein
MVLFRLFGRNQAGRNSQLFPSGAGFAARFRLKRVFEKQQVV